MMARIGRERKFTARPSTAAPSWSRAVRIGRPRRIVRCGNKKTPSASIRRTRAAPV